MTHTIVLNQYKAIPLLLKESLLRLRRTFRTFGFVHLLLLIVSGCSWSEDGLDRASSHPLARTLGIVAQSTSTHPQILRILFYGQSITAPMWTDTAVAHLRKTYPNTRFDVRNMAIGGFSSRRLERTVERDIADFYPDLVVLHVYGDHRAYERIVRTIRSQTVADVILQTNHVTSPVEPVCREGLRLTLSHPSGCKGLFWYTQNSWEEFMSSTLIPQLADRYRLAVEPRRVFWDAYLSAHKLQPESLLADVVHPNAEGWRLIAQSFTQFFDRAVADYRGEQSHAVTRLSLSEAAGVQYQFVGNRVEIVGSGLLDGKVIASIDGHSSKDIDGCWLASRTTYLPNSPDWPAIKKVTIAPGAKQAESWTVRVTDFNANQSDFRFTLTSDHTGQDGDGRGSEDFKSISGRIRIESKDWMIRDGYSLTQKKVPEGFEIAWSRTFICGDQLPVATGVGDEIEVRHVLVTGLNNGPHQMSIQVTSDAAPLVRELRVYQPPLRD